MNFFKKLFSAKKSENKPEADPAEVPFQGIHTTDYFDKRYTEDSIEPDMLDGCLKMVESYFLDNKIEQKIKKTVNHPANLDQVVQDGFGFVLYCNAFKMGEREATLFLAYAFSDFLVQKYGFKLFRDAQPEYPLRSMTLKYDKNGVVLSLYPYEYASKVLNEDQSFEALESKLSVQIAHLPDKDTILYQYGPQTDDDQPE